MIFTRFFDILIPLLNLTPFILFFPFFISISFLLFIVEDHILVRICCILHLDAKQI